MKYSIVYIIFLFSFGISQSLLAQPNHFGGHSAKTRWEKLYNNNTNIFFPKGWKSSAIEIAQYINNFDSLTQSTNLGSLKLKANFVLQPFTTQSNGYVAYGPFKSELYLSPNPDVYSQSSGEWLQQLTYHEYRHIQQFKAFRQYPIPKVLYFLTGEFGVDFFGNLIIPSYFWEGDAVYHETRFTSAGRGRIHPFLNNTKAFLSNNRHYTWMQWRNGSMLKNMPNHYSLGYVLTSYGYEKYGDDFWRNITNSALRLKGGFNSFQKSFQSNYNISYKQFRENALNSFKEKNSGWDTSASQSSDLFRSNQYWSYWIDSSQIIYLENSYKKQSRFYIEDIHSKNKIPLNFQWISNEKQFHYNNQNIVYTNYSVHPRWNWTSFQDIILYDLKSNKQQQITNKGKYFQPSIDENGQQIIAISQQNSSNQLHILSKQINQWDITQIKNEENFKYHHPKIVNGVIYSLVHTKDAKMSIAIIDTNGNHQLLVEPMFAQMGNFVVQNDTIFVNMNDDLRDRIYAIVNGEIFELNDRKNYNNYYYFDIKNNQLTYSNFEIEGLTIQSTSLKKFKWNKISAKKWEIPTTPYLFNSSNEIYLNEKMVDSIQMKSATVSSLGSPFKIYSWIPTPVAEDEISLRVEGANILNSLYAFGEFSYNTTNRLNKISAGIGLGLLFSKLALNFQHQSRSDFYIPQGDSTVFASAFDQKEINLSATIPLVFYKKRSIHLLSTQIMIGKLNRDSKFVNNTRDYNIFRATIQYSQYIPPAQNNIQTRLGYSLLGRIDRNWGKTTANRQAFIGTLFLPGFGANHALDIALNYQYLHRNNQIAVSEYITLSRGFRQVYVNELIKTASNYHLPVVYPDWGFGNLYFIQKIRAQLLFDHTKFTYYNNNQPTTNTLKGEAISAGAWVWLDGKIWNQYGITVGFRYTHAVKNDYRIPFENYSISIPINL